MMEAEKMVKFAMLNPDDEAAILDRAGLVGSARFGLAMDLGAANAVCLLDTAKLIGFPDFDFWHDIHGIRANLNRETGELNHFLPRCAEA